MSVYSAVLLCYNLSHPLFYSIYVEIHIYCQCVCICSPLHESEKFSLLVYLAKMLLLLCSYCSGHTEWGTIPAISAPLKNDFP